jgi:tetratricopeptide (TPR) repeat protein
LAFYEKAESLRPDVHLYTYRKASALFNLDEYSAALAALKSIEDASISESNVHLLLGRIHKRMGRKDLALKSLSLAQDVCSIKIVGIHRCCDQI